MTEDKELLEMAAKAAGLPEYFEGLVSSTKDDPFHVWNPLKDNGDAARLMTQFGFDICKGNDAERGEFCEVLYRPRKYARKKSFVEYYQDHPDKFAAGRRAIVRATAALGEAKK